jgi:hypothetical protein
VSIVPAMKRVVQRIAKTDEARFVAPDGAIGKRALSEYVLDALEDRHPDVLPLRRKKPRSGWSRRSSGRCTARRSDA